MRLWNSWKAYVLKICTFIDVPCFNSVSQSITLMSSKIRCFCKRADCQRAVSDARLRRGKNGRGYWYNCLYSNWCNRLAFMERVSPNGSLLSPGIIKSEGLLNATRSSRNAGSPSCTVAKKVSAHYTSSHCNSACSLYNHSNNFHHPSILS